MDTIELKKYHPLGGLSKRTVEFYEFFVNDKPLSETLTEFCGLDHSLLDDWIGVFGSFSSRQAELNTIKRLLLKQITDNNEKKTLQFHFDKYQYFGAFDTYRKTIENNHR